MNKAIPYGELMSTVALRVAKDLLLHQNIYTYL